MPHFNAKAFEKNLDTIPDDLLVEMASDGIISRDEIEHLSQLLNLDDDVAAALMRNSEAVSATIMEYVQENMPGAMAHNMCQVTGRQVAEIMRHMLDKGLISQFYETDASVSAQQGLPQGKSIHDVGKSSGGSRSKR